jgi:hypothetical protein
MIEEILLDIDNKEDQGPEIPLYIQERMTAVLRKVASGKVIGHACDESGVRRKDHYEWMKKYPKYKELYEEIHEVFVDGLEQVAIDRAKEKSDSLLLALLKAERREKFGDQGTLSVKNGNSGVTLMFAEGMLSDEEKALISRKVETDED